MVAGRAVDFLPVLLDCRSLRVGSVKPGGTVTFLLGWGNAMVLLWPSPIVVVAATSERGSVLAGTLRTAWGALVALLRVERRITGASILECKDFIRIVVTIKQ